MVQDTGHYHFALLKYLLDLQYTVALINPKTNDFNRKMQGGITKNDKLDTINICDVLDTPERLKECARSFIGISSSAEVIQIKHLSAQIELIEEQLAEIDKKIEEFSIQNNSPILSIPGISHFSGTAILAELGDISNYSKPSQIIKFAGVAPLHYESSQFNAQQPLPRKDPNI